jgi:ATP-dependent Clp protease, protease subunit
MDVAQIAQSPQAPQPVQPPQRVYLAFSTNITPQSVGKLLTECANCSNQGVKEIHILFASFGGNVAAGIYAYNVLRALPLKLVTYNVGNVDSIANVVFLAGEERFAVPHATFMFHGVSFDFSGNLHVDRPWLTDRLDSLNADHKKMALIIKDRAKFDNIDEILNLFSTQATRDAEFAHAKGLVHKVEHAKVPTGNRLLVFPD